MFDAKVPDDVVNPLVAPSNRLKVLMRAMPEQPRFPVWTHAFVAPDMLGRLHPGTVNGTPSERGPVPGCGWPLRDGRPAEIALTKSTFAWPWVLKVSYFTNTPTPARITFGGHTEQVELRTGLNDLFVQITGAGDQVRIDGLNPAAQVCVAGIVVGTPAPKVAK
jgi:hypothetical protein